VCNTFEPSVKIIWKTSGLSIEVHYKCQSPEGNQQYNQSQQQLAKSIKEGTVVRHSSEKGAIIYFTIFFHPKYEFQSMLWRFWAKNFIWRPNGEFLYIDIFFCKSYFFHFLVLKTGKLSNFTMDKFVSVYKDHFPVKVQVENFSKSIKACGGAQLRLDSVLKPNNTENSTNKTENPSSPYPRALY
jgi:hypothetical protein